MSEAARSPRSLRERIEHVVDYRAFRIGASAVASAGMAIAVIGILDTNNSAKRPESSTARAQALAQSYAAKISSIAVQDAVESGRPVNVSYSDGQTRLDVNEHNYSLWVDYTTSGMSTAPQDVQSVAISYFPKPHQSVVHKQYYFLMANGEYSGMPGWSMGQAGSVTGPAVPETFLKDTSRGFTSYNTGYNTIPSGWSKLGVERMTSLEFTALEDGANLALQHIQADANQ